MKQAIILLAPGCEEVEALTPVDLLRRAGVEVTMLSITDQLAVTGSHNITFQADALLSEFDTNSADMLILPGGIPGTLHLEDDKLVQQVILQFQKDNKYLAAICAAPKVFGNLGVLKGKRAICYPGYEEELLEANVTCEEVVVDGKIITSRGLGTAITFGLKLVELLTAKDKSETLAKKIIYKEQ